MEIKYFHLKLIKPQKMMGYFQ